MRGAVAWFITVVAVPAAALYGLDLLEKAEHRYGYESELDALKREFVRGVPALPLIADAEYPDAVSTGLADYFRELEALAHRYPEHFSVERARTEVDAKVQSGQMTQAQRDQRTERIDFTLALFDQMRRGAYRPLYTAADRGFRFDIVDISPYTVGSTKRLKLTFVHWGAYGDVSYRSITGRFKSDSTVGIPRLEGVGQAPNLLVEPERWVAEFVPGAQIGFYDFPLMPASAEELQLSFSFDIKTPAAKPLSVAIEFLPMVLPDAWKSTEVWAATERKLSAEELAAEAE
ncbi:MAG: hypothetical protein AAF654_09530 [Myxococcota bacterium]